MKILNKLIITKWKNRILTVLFSDRQPLEIGLEENTSILGNIYIGKVNRIVKNLNSAFVDFEKGQTGYYSLSDNPCILYADGHEGTLKAGDEIIVQVARDAVRTKDPVLSSNLNFTGQYGVLTARKTIVGFSSRISDKAWKEQLRPVLEAALQDEAGLIVRTNAYGHEEQLLDELKKLQVLYRNVRQAAAYRTCYSLLYRPDPEYIKTIRSCPLGSLEEIVTDVPEVFEQLRLYFDSCGPEQQCSFRLYEDSMICLSNLYSLESVMDRACQKRVWLKSGGYLVIEYTEAMVVIDVNTGKYSGKKNQDDTIRMTNREAAEEISRQLRLRNLSGIIMVDFIDMKRQEDKNELMDYLKRLVRHDPVKTTVVDMTQLNLVEITRKKEKKPLWEQLSQKE